MSISEPAKITTPWASTGSKNPIPANANNTTGAAGFDKGFPDITMTPEEAGGLPPAGQDFNGIFYQITEIIRHIQAGGQHTFSPELASAIGGYPEGAIVLGNDGRTLWQNKVDSNTGNPNIDPANWSMIDVNLRADLALSSGSEAVGNGAGTLDGAVNSPKPLSYYGDDQAALHELLNYAKTTGNPVRLTSDVQVSTVIDIDFSGAKLVMYFDGHSILSDSECLVLRNLSQGSEIHAPNLRNVTTPWVISRWDADGNWINPVLTQSNGPMAYMPTVNDSDIWGTLTPAQQNQTISPKMRIVSSDGVSVYTPKGRFALYEFEECNNCVAHEPDIELGGKGQFGTILFKNIATTGYGVGNKVIGGRVSYGSFSGACFMRNKKGGVTGGFVPFRSGESGVKTYQGEVSGRSARCYDMVFDGIYPYQTVYDGVDFLSDYGDTPTERVDDFTLAQYPWHELPTKHFIGDIISTGCNGVGIWGDGRFNEHRGLRAVDCRKSGIKNIGKYQYFKSVTAVNCNRANAPTGEHQINIPSVNSIDGVRVIVENSANITNGYSLYAPESTCSDVDVSLVENTGIAAVLMKREVIARRSAAIEDNGATVSIALRGRSNQMINPTGVIGSDVTLGISGNEGGDAFMRGVSGGVPVHGMRASGDFGGAAVLAVANSAAAGGGALANSEMSFYLDGASLKIALKDASGVVTTIPL